MSRKIKVILVLGVLLRLIIMPFTYHSDIQPFDLAGYVISKGYTLNFYDYFPNQNRTNPLKITFHDYNFNYPPAVYFSLGTIANIFSPAVGEQFRVQYLSDVKSTFGTPKFYIHQFTLKLPYLFFDIGLSLLLLKFFETEKQRVWVMLLWVLNPLSLLSSFLMGGFDIIPTFFTVLALYLVWKNNSRRNLYMAAISLGLGTAFKIYPLYLLVPLMGLTDDWRERVKIALLSVLPYILFALPFLGSYNFRSSALLAGQSTKSFYAQIPVSGGEAIILFPAILIFFYILFLKYRVAGGLLWQRFLIVFLLLFIFTHYHPQWFLWVTPFLILELVFTRFSNWLALTLMMVSFTGLLFFFDPGLSFGLFSPLNPSLYNSYGLWDVLHLHPDYNFSRSVLQTVFVGAAIYYLYIYSFKKPSIE